ncbi:MAG TPA: pseudaminic acid biosynthesis-associated methylase [Bryobacteraceae bacterium]|nr:pseudaminic acid biosynthesis-associated methylase [Bryobacteraceae bacterium]
MERGQFTTEQERFWAGEFGDAYIDRNRMPGVLAAKTALLARVLASAGAVNSVLEFGANIGMNLVALRTLVPEASFTAVEINHKAAAELKSYGWLTAHETSIFDFETEAPADLVLSSGLLIHIQPQKLGEAYRALYGASRRYVCIVEYYNPTPVEVPYRGERERLFKRDFAGEMMDLYPDLQLRGYGFRYHRDPVFPMDDATWFLLEKREVR